MTANTLPDIGTQRYLAAARMFDFQNDSPNKIRESRQPLAIELAERLKKEVEYSQPLTFRIGPLGSRNDYLYMIRFRDGSIYVRTGCFLGTLDEFESELHMNYPDDQINIYTYRKKTREQYEAAIVAMRTFASFYV